MANIIISKNHESTTIRRDEKVLFTTTVTESNNTPISYKWYLNNVLQSSTTDKFDYSPGLEESAVIYCEITQSEITTQSNKITLTVTVGSFQPLITFSRSGFVSVEDFPMDVSVSISNVPNNTTAKITWNIDGIIYSGNTVTLTNPRSTLLTTSIEFSAPGYALTSYQSNARIQVPEVIKVDNTIIRAHKLTSRDSSYIPVPYWVLDELISISIGKTNVGSSKYYNDVLSLGMIISNNNNVEVQESRNGRILSKPQIMESLIPKEYIPGPPSQNYNPYVTDVITIANENAYVLPSNITAYNKLIDTLDLTGILAKLDVLYILNGDGDINFKLLNIINPTMHNGTSNGGLVWNTDGVQGNGSNGFINTNFNPSLGDDRQMYKLNSVGFGVIRQKVVNATRNDTLLSVASNNPSIHAQFGSGFIRVNVQSVGLGNEQGGLSASKTPGSVFVTNNATTRNVIVDSTNTVVNLSAGNVPTVLPNVNLAFFGSSGLANAINGQYVASLAFLGGEITYEDSQVIRHSFNEYLSALGKERYA